MVQTTTADITTPDLRGPVPTSNEKSQKFANKVRSRSVSNPPRSQQAYASGSKVKGKARGAKSKQASKVSPTIDPKNHGSENVISKTQNPSNTTATKFNNSPSISMTKRKKPIQKVNTKSLSSIVQLVETETTEKTSPPTDTENTTPTLQLVASNYETAASASQGFKIAKSRSVVLKSSLKQTPKSSSRVSFKTTENGSLAVQEKRFLKVTRSKKIIKSPKRLKSASVSNLYRSGKKPTPSVTPFKASVFKKPGKVEDPQEPSATRSTGNISANISVKTVKSTSSKLTKAPRSTVLSKGSSYVTVVTPELFKQLKEISSPKLLTTPVVPIPKNLKTMSSTTKPLPFNPGGEKEKVSSHLEDAAKTKRKSSFMKSKSIVGGANASISRQGETLSPETIAQEVHEEPKVAAIPSAQTVEVDADSLKHVTLAKIDAPVGAISKITKKVVKA